MPPEELLWIIFGSVVFFFFVLDLGVLNRKAHKVSLKEASIWCAIWVSAALLFNLGIYLKLGHDFALKFLTAYIIEYSLSVDNMFVFIMIFSYFGIPAQYQPKVLHWGIMGAIVMRLILIFSGVALLNKFYWLIYIFGGILIISGIKMLKNSDEKFNPSENAVLKMFKKLIPFCDDFGDGKFFVRHSGRICATTIFAAVLVIEASDLVFAVDSIPAVLAISNSKLIVYTSNIFAILGLRSLFFLLAGVMDSFRFLKYGISAILIFVGVKMMISHFVKMPTLLSLSVVAGTIAVSILASLVIKGENKNAA